VVLVSGIAVVDLIAKRLDRPPPGASSPSARSGRQYRGHACNVSADLVRLGSRGPGSGGSSGRPRSLRRFPGPPARRTGRPGRAVLTDRAPTSLDLILVARGEDRRYHADAGANVEMTAPPVLALLERHRPRVFYAGGWACSAGSTRTCRGSCGRAQDAGRMTFV